MHAVLPSHAGARVVIRPVRPDDLERGIEFAQGLSAPSALLTHLALGLAAQAPGAPDHAP